MAVKQSSGFCRTCDRKTLFQKPKINNAVHLILSIFTVGVWLIVWIPLGILNSMKQPRCTQCGGYKRLLP